MLLFLSTPEYTSTQSNTTKVRVSLTNGSAEIYDKHQDLMGRIENNIMEVETAFENRVEKTMFIVQNGVFVVSTKGLEATPENAITTVYLYARRVLQVTQNLSIDELVKEYEKKQAILDVLVARLLAKKEGESLVKPLGSKLLLLEEEVTFLRRAIVIVKALKDLKS